MDRRLDKSGFTLLELSIVLVIIALLAGGVLVGRDLIRQAEIRAVHREVDEYKSSISVFKLKYEVLPGDMSNATAYLGTASGGCLHGSRTGTQTCNGNGNGAIEFSHSLFLPDIQESWLAWQHLSNAGLIAGQFSGSSNWPQVRTARVDHPVFGTNVPPSQAMSGVAFFLYTSPNIGVPGWAVDFFLNLPALFISVGRNDNDMPFTFRRGFLSPQEALMWDEKYDDGKPGTGKVMWLGLADLGASSPRCSSGGSAMDPGAWTFNLATQGQACAAHIQIQ